MGIFGKAIGSVDDNVITNGILGRGEITNVVFSGVTVRTSNNPVERKCTISLNVMIDNVEAFQATAVQRIRDISLSRVAKNSIVPVRVDPNDHSKVYIDFASQVPVVTAPRSTGENSYAYMLEHGKPIKVIFLSSVPMRIKNADGHDMHVLSLTVYEGVDTPYQTQVGNPLPASALPLAYPGSKLHAKLSAGGGIAVDWAAGAAT